MVPLFAEPVFHLFGVPITNTLLHTVIVDALIILGIFFLRNISLVPTMFQNIVEFAVEGLYSLTETVSPKHAKIIFPYFMSFFVFILIANWTSLIPGFGTIGIKDHGELIPFLRAATSDINVTLSLAIIATVATQYLAIKTIGIKHHLARYLSWNPIFLFVGLLELLSVFTNIISLSFRLFGNIFAGDVVITTISGMFAFLLPLPFLSLEILVGMVQALVFAMLTMSFMAILTTPHNEGGEH